MAEWIILSGCCLGASFILLAVGIAVGLWRYRRAKRWGDRAEGQKRRVLSPFQWFLAFFFLAAAFIFLPVYVFDGGWEAVAWVRSVLLSVHNAMRLFILDGDFKEVGAFLSDVQLPEVMRSVYTVYAALLFVAAPVLAAGFVLSFFRNVGSVLRYLLCRPAHLVYMSELNERSLALAENILREEKKGTKVIFCDVFVKNEETEFELLSEAARLGAICFRKDVTQIPLRRGLHHTRRTFYLIGKDEDENVKQALFLLRHCIGVKTYNNENTRFFVFSTTPASEPLLDSTEQGKMQVRRVNEARSLAWSTVVEKRIFSKYREENGEKTVSVLIVGSGGYGTELAKVILWCGQLPRYRVKVHVVDSKKNARSLFRSHSPELVEGSDRTWEGYPQYTLQFHEGVDVNTSEFDDLIEEIGPFTSVFVTLGDDDKNVATAMKINREVRRLEKGEGLIPTIYAVVYSSLKLATLQKNGERLKCLDEYDYDISFFGDMRTRYSPEVIERRALDQRGRQIHMEWARKKNGARWRQDLEECGGNAEKAAQKGEERCERYDRYEYYRTASMATALYEQILTVTDLSEEEFAAEGKEKYEHLRWYAYMGAEGYRAADKINFVGKVHSAMTAYRRADATETEKETEESRNGIRS